MACWHYQIGIRYKACFMGLVLMFGIVSLFIYGGKDDTVATPRFAKEGLSAGTYSRKHHVMRKPAQEGRNRPPEKQKTILVWEAPFGDQGMAIEFTFADPLPNDTENLVVKSPQCGNCRITYNQSLISVSDAVLFHAFYPNETTYVPRKGNKNQVFVWWSQESSANKPYYGSMRKYFDCTMTSSRNADVFSPYASFPWILKMLKMKGKGSDIMKRMANTKREYQEDPEEVAGLISHYIDSSSKTPKFEERGDRNLTRLLKRKRRLAAWVVSNCYTDGAMTRSDLIDEIERKGLNIDAFGNCRGQSFPISSRWDPAFYEVLSIYKFYMSFENSVHCRDYMTEKTWFNALYSGAVPIIWGPHRDDVAAVLPPKSYILVEDFPSVKKLVDYLRYLDKNNTAYAEYLQWRTWLNYLNKDGEYTVHNLKRLPRSEQPSPTVKALLEKYARPKPVGFCRLCAMLHASQPMRCKSSKRGGVDVDERSECLDYQEAQEIAENLYLPKGRLKEREPDRPLNHEYEDM